MSYRYFFDANGNCISIILENPTNNTPPIANANAIYLVDGNAGADVSKSFRDSAGNLRNTNTVVITDAGSTTTQLIFNISATWFPVNLTLTGLNATGVSQTLYQTITSAGTYYAVGTWYSSTTVSIIPNGGASASSITTCDCYSCDCGGS